MDFPAAHSMDTGWFAVDRDGHVAHFDSGEAGAVPEEGNRGQDWEYEILERLERRPETTPWRVGVYDREGLVLPGGARHLATPRDALFLFLRTLEPVAEAIAAGRAVALPTLRSDEHAVSFANIDPALRERLHADGHCLACLWPPSDYRGAARLGLFVYHHLCENWIAGPYTGGCTAPATRCTSTRCRPTCAPTCRWCASTSSASRRRRASSRWGATSATTCATSTSMKRA